jgi:histone deacetylase HOS3
MALRVRKPAKPVIESVEEDEPKKQPAAAKSNRRKTVAGAAVLAAEKVCPYFTSLLHQSGISIVQSIPAIGNPNR